MILDGVHRFDSCAGYWLADYRRDRMKTKDCDQRKYRTVAETSYGPTEQTALLISGWVDNYETARRSTKHHLDRGKPVEIQVKEPDGTVKTLDELNPERDE